MLSFQPADGTVTHTTFPEKTLKAVAQWVISRKIQTACIIRNIFSLYFLRYVAKLHTFFLNIFSLLLGIRLPLSNGIPSIKFELPLFFARYLLFPLLIESVSHKLVLKSKMSTSQPLRLSRVAPYAILIVLFWMDLVPWEYHSQPNYNTNINSHMIFWLTFLISSESRTNHWKHLTDYK